MNIDQEIRATALKAALEYRPVMSINLLLQVAEQFEHYIAGELTYEGSENYVPVIVSLAPDE